MAEPSNAAYSIPDYFSSGSRCEAWPNNMSMHTHGLMASVGTDVGQGTQPQRVEAFQYSVMAPVDPQFDGGGSDWTSTENTRPISTPPAVVEQPTSVAAFGGQFQHAGQWYTNVDVGNNGANPCPYVGEGFDRQPIFMNVAPGSAGGFHFHHHATATARPLDLTTPCQFQQGSLPYYQQATLPANYPTEIAIVQGGSLQQYGSASDRVYQYRSAYDGMIPRNELQQGSSTLDCGNMPMPMGEHLAPLRPSVLKSLLSTRASTCDDQPTPPMGGNATSLHGVAIKTESKPARTVNCYSCGRLYLNERTYHDHWLRVHVLQTPDVVKNKRKRVESLSTMADDCPRPSTMAKEAKVDGGTTLGATPHGLKSSENGCEGSCTITRSGNEASMMAMVPSCGNQPQMITAMESSNVNPVMTAVADSNLVLDLSLKPNSGVTDRDKNTGARHSLLLIGADSRQQQAQPQCQGSFSVDGQTVETRPRMTAECLTIRSSSGNLALIFPPGLSSAAMKVPRKEAQATERTSVETAQQQPPPPPEQNADAGEEADGSSKSPEKTYACDNCPKTYRSRRSLNKHVRAHHHHPAAEPKQQKSVFADVVAMEQLPFACHLCPKRFETEKSRNQHLSFHRKAETQ